MVEDKKNKNFPKIDGIERPPIPTGAHPLLRPAKSKKGSNVHVAAHPLAYVPPRTKPNS